MAIAVGRPLHKVKKPIHSGFCAAAAARQRGRVLVCAASDDDENGLAREFEALTQRDKFSKLASKLQLVYDASERGKVESCSCCRGSGEQECNWCHGTGAMTIGDTLYCSNGGCTPCPVCRGTGACKCPNCRGTGNRASWLATSG